MKFRKLGYCIEIPLKFKGYSVLCTYHPTKEEGKFSISMSLRCATVDDNFKIDSQDIDEQVISSTRETINEDILRIVEEAFRVGFFKPYIERYEFTYKCFNRGLDLEEAERMAKNV